MASEGVNVLTHDERTGFGVLHAAARGGQPELLQRLLAWDIEVLDDSGSSPLHSSSHRTLDGGAVFKCALLSDTNLLQPVLQHREHPLTIQCVAIHFPLPRKTFARVSMELLVFVCGQRIFQNSSLSTEQHCRCMFP